MDAITIANIILAISTGILVLVTAYYAWQTKKMVDEMALAKRMDFLPFLKLSLKPAYLGGICALKITNIGRGPAKDITIGLSLKPSDKTKEVAYPIITKEDSVYVLAPFGEDLTLKKLKEYTSIELSGTCSDILGNQIRLCDSLDIKALEKAVNDRYVERGPIVDKLSDIVSKLGEIKYEISKK